MQVYGFGLSEEFVGEFMRTTGIEPVIATKFAPLPWRYTADNVVKSLKYGALPCMTWPAQLLVSA